MPDELAAESQKTITIKKLLRTCVEIFSSFGYKKAPLPENLLGRQIIFENQKIGADVSSQLAVVYLPIEGKAKSLTFNFGCSLMPGRTSPLKLQGRQIKEIKIQLAETEEYSQLAMQIYFLEPLNYSMEDLIYRMRTEKYPGGFRIKSGYPWLSAEKHIPDETALELAEMALSVL